MMRLATIFLLTTVVLVGCGEVRSAKYESSHDSSVGVQSADSTPGWNTDSDSETELTEAKTNGIETKNVKPDQRKIVYNSSVEVIVKNFDGIPKKLNDLVIAHGGFIGNANLGSMTGQHRSGHWVVRIPSDQYREFLSSVGNIGVLESQQENAEDVTEEYVDITARIENKKKLETRIVALLESHDEELKEIIRVEQELARVREEIERMTGRLRYLTDATSFATININIREQMEYAPAQQAGFGERIKTAWGLSLTHCQTVFQNVTLFVVRNAIGFCVLAVMLLLAIPVIRRLVRYLNRSFKRAVATEQ